MSQDSNQFPNQLARQLADRLSRIKPTVSLVTLNVTDLARATAFYRDVMGFPVWGKAHPEVAFFQLNGLVLSLYLRPLLAEDAGFPKDEPVSRFSGVTLAQNVEHKDDVDAILAAVELGGATILRPGFDTDWGGRVGYFADPEGNAWEIAWNPGFPMDERGVLQLPPNG